MAMTLALFQVSLVQSLWLIEDLSGLLLKPLLADACSYPDWLACECLRDHSLASENNYRFKKGVDVRLKMSPQAASGRGLTSLSFSFNCIARV